MTWTKRAILALACLLPLLPSLLATRAMAHVSDVGPGGYYWVDDRQPGHSFQDPKFLAPQVLPLNGSATAPVALPFGFTYFGKRYDHAEATADGRLVLRFLGGERTRIDEEGRQRIDDVAARPDIAVLDVFGGVRPDEMSTIVYNASPEGFVTFRWASFEAAPATPITFEAHLRDDGAIRFQYWQMNELLGSPAYGMVGDIGLSDPSGGSGLRVMSNGNPTKGFSLRSASVLDFGREVGDLPGPGPQPKAVQCPPAYGLPNDFPTWCDRVQAGDDRIPGTADDKDVCLTNVTDGTHTPCTTSRSDQWLFREDAFCQGCPYTFYVLVDCGTDMHMPTHDVEAMRVSIIDLNTGLPQIITAENECIKKRDAGIAWPYCDACALAGIIVPKEDPLPGIGKPANSCTTPFGATTELPCLAYRESSTNVGWGTPINQATPDVNGNTVLDPDEMDSPPCVNCDTGTVPVCNCGTTTGANRVTEEQDIDVVLYGTPTLTGIYRLELLSGGFEWQLFTNCDGNNTPLYNIYDKCSEAILAYNPLPELALDPNAAESFKIVDESGCPTSVRVSVTMCNIGGGATPVAAPSAPFTIRFFDGGTQVGTPFNGDMATATDCDSGTGLPLDINECRTCRFDVPVGQADLVAEITIDRNFQVDECSETPTAVQCRLGTGSRTRRIPVCAANCIITAEARVPGGPFCFGAPVTIDASRSTISSCGGVAEYQYEELDRTTGLWVVISPYGPGNTFSYTPSTDGAKTIRVVVRCSTDPTCNNTSSPVNFTVATDSDGDGVSDSCGDLCPNTPNINLLPTDCNGDGDTADAGEAVGQQCEQDGDFIGDACDNCVTNFNPDQENSDTDTLGDECDNCRLVDNQAQANADGDAFGDVCDNCPGVPNSTLQDLDGDGLIDAAIYGEFPQSDLDSDLIGDLCDNCPFLPNPGNLFATDCNGDGDTTDPGEAIGEQCDRDGDGVGDPCDNCPRNANARNEDPAGFDCNGNGTIENGPGEPFGEAWLLQCDFDGDGVGDPCDNCPTTFNPITPPATQQGDTDGDGVGNVCDNCPFISNPPHAAPTDCNADGDTSDPGEGAGEQCNVCLCIATPIEALSGLVGDPHFVLEKSQVQKALLITSRDDITVSAPLPEFVRAGQGDYTVDLFGVPITANFIDNFNVYRGTIASLRQTGLPLADPARYDHVPFTPVGLESCSVVTGVTEARTAPFTQSAKGIYDVAACIDPDVPADPRCLGDNVNYFYLIVAECASDALEGGYGSQALDGVTPDTPIPSTLVPCP